MRRIRMIFAVYAVSLPVLFHIIPNNIFFAFVSFFFLSGVTVGFKEYKESIKKLKYELNSRLEDDSNKKKRLEQEIKMLDGDISGLRNKEMMIVNLYEITKKMSQGLTFNEIFNALTAFLKENFIFKKIELLILKEEGRDIKVDKVYKVNKEETDKETDERRDYSHILRLFSKDKKELYIPNEDGTSFAAMPLLSEKKFIGILAIDDLPQADFDRFLIVAMQFALEIKKVLLYETVEELAITDSLTGLYTRRYFFERLNEELNRSKKHDFKFAFLMIDIDNFKRCNDTYGHLVGDVILKEVARIIKENIREIDLLARYGGEEFSLILPETDKKGAMLAGERIRKKIEENIFKAYDEKIKMTVSIGLALYPDDSQDTENIIEKADKALYVAKSSGKNIVCEYKD